MKWWSARSKRTQAILVLVGLFVLYAIIGPKAAPVTTSTSPTPTSAAAAATAGSPAPTTAAPTATPAPTPTPTASPIMLSGTGQTATAEIRLPSTMSMGTFTHQGRSNFAVYAFRGDRKDLLVNDIGAYAGIVPLFYAEPIRLQIEADGPWSVTIASVEGGGTVTASGQGDWVGKYFTPPGTGSYRFTHSGTSNFAVYLHCGGQRQLIQNEIGAFNGTKIIQFGRAPCVWEVNADGTWAIAAV